MMMGLVMHGPLRSFKECVDMPNRTGEQGFKQLFKASVGSKASYVALFYLFIL
jgi:hypothetical protein